MLCSFSCPVLSSRVVVCCVVLCSVVVLCCAVLCCVVVRYVSAPVVLGCAGLCAPCCQQNVTSNKAISDRHKTMRSMIAHQVVAKNKTIIDRIPTGLNMAGIGTKKARRSFPQSSGPGFTKCAAHLVAPGGRNLNTSCRVSALRFH